MDREYGIDWRRMKSQDPIWTNGGEGGILIHIWGSRTEAKGLKVIRYRPNFSCKLCRHFLLVFCTDGKGRNLSVRALGIVRSQGWNLKRNWRKITTKSGLCCLIWLNAGKLTKSKFTKDRIREVNRSGAWPL